MLESNLQMVFSNKGKWCAHGRTISPCYSQQKSLPLVAGHNPEVWGIAYRRGGGNWKKQLIGPVWPVK